MPDLVASKYLLNHKTFVAKEVSFAETEIGDIKQSDFHPQVKVKRWDNEVNFSARLVHEEKSPRVVTTDDGKIQWLGEKVEAHFYDLGLQEEGGYEFEIVLKEPPKSNIISLTIQTKGLDFFYQPPLPNLNPDGSTWGDNGWGQQCIRPANVNGSYAVFHATQKGDYTALGGKNYKAGKAFHIYRPRIEDATGASCWGELNIDVKAGLLTVTIPQDWLDQAVYPVRHAAGLTFGYTSIGGSIDNSGNMPNWSKAYTLPGSNGSLTSLSIYGSINSGSPQFACALYSDSGSLPSARLAYTETGTLFGSSFGWVTTNLSYASITAGTQYWLGSKSGVNTTSFNYYYDTGAADELQVHTVEEGWPSPAAPNAAVAQRISFYATYTVPGVTGTLAGTLASVTGSASGVRGVTGTEAGTVSQVTGAVAGAHGVAGSAAGTLGNVTAAAVGQVRAEGNLSGTLAPVTGAITGTASGPTAVTGTLTGNLTAVTGNLAGLHGAAAVVAGTLSTCTGTVSGLVQAEGGLAGSLANIFGSLSGVQGIAGQISGTLNAITGSVSGKHGVTGVVAGTLATITGSFTGTVPGVVSGTLAGLLTNVTASFVGAHGVTGPVANTLAKVSVNITGAHGAAGTLTGQIDSITATISGSVGGIATGLLAGTLTPITASMMGLVVVTGSLTGTLQPVTAAFFGTVGPDTAARWKFPALFSESGFTYGDYDPGQTAAIAIGCLHIYMRTGDSRANTWARRILDDLRINRQSPDYPYLYKSDLHHVWLNALVAQAFGLAVTGRPGQAYAFASTREDHDHFLNMVNQFFARSGDSKPNVLNADLIPFSYIEASDNWTQAPNYIMNQQMGSLEALVLMLEVALDYARLQGDWDWFNRLVAFILRDNLVVLNQAQIRTVTAACDQAGAANLVRLRYADYDRDSSNYYEARDQAAIDNWGEQALDLDLRYGSPVIMEDPAAAQLLATRMLQRLAPPQEAVEVETWLEGVRIELGDTAAVSSDFHGWDREEFTVLGRDLDLGHRRVLLKLSRPLDRTDPFAVDAGGSASDAWAIDQASSWDENWDSRAYVY